jgi:hypothetical protein
MKPSTASAPIRRSRSASIQSLTASTLALCLPAVVRRRRRTIFLLTMRPGRAFDVDSLLAMVTSYKAVVRRSSVLLAASTRAASSPYRLGTS